MKKIAIMQPYFVPYAGYFRLMQAADIFVIYDCVQFPRRGYVHRNKLRREKMNDEWLTLPLLKQVQSTKINELSFKEDAQNIFLSKLKKLAIFEKIEKQSDLLELLNNFEVKPSNYIANLLKYFCHLLNIKTNFVYSSTLNISNDLRGKDRIIEIVNQLEGNHYINSPNGRNLYNSSDFKKHNIHLRFLNDYQGDYISILESYFSKTKEERFIFSQDIKNQSN